MERLKAHQIFWDAHVRREKNREKDLEKKIHTDLVWREIEPLIRPGIQVLDAGGGFGRYSIELARRGCQVVHLDLSLSMVEEAKKQAQRAGVSLEFVVGKIQDLSRFEDGCFDLVLSLDAPISYAYPEEKKALREVARVTKRFLVLSVVNRLGQLPVALEMELRWHKKLTWIKKFWESGNWDHPSFFEAMEERIPFFSRFLFPPFHAFTPQEIIDLVMDSGLKVRRCVATGTLARLLSSAARKKLVRDPELYREFLEFSLHYDAQFEVLGVGCKVASGFLLVGEKEKNNEEDMD
ncbi:MAG: methyltransferase domain-containing protein [Atribacterota bacterium]|nr:methyltransferase domain-containing protein [Atribacterota bacterium]